MHSFGVMLDLSLIHISLENPEEIPASGTRLLAGSQSLCLERLVYGVSGFIPEFAALSGVSALDHADVLS